MKSVIAKRFIEISIEVYNQPLLGIILLAGNLLGASPALPAWSLWEEFYLLLGLAGFAGLDGVMGGEFHW
ncbi:MAG: hypothetical protein SO114_08520 [Candidatus Cryptobacteroides sp.]|nr:hypothetical protein [Candidatus Cryptobacteroides sp.]